MSHDDSQAAERAMARKGRTAALVIAGTVLVWLVGTWGVQAAGLPPRFLFLFDFAAIAGFIWVFAVIWQMWQLRKRINDNGLR